MEVYKMDGETEDTKFRYSPSQLYRQIKRTPCTRRHVFRLLGTFVLTTVFIEGILFLSGVGIFYLSTSPVYDIKTSSNGDDIIMKPRSVSESQSDLQSATMGDNIGNSQISNNTLLLNTLTSNSPNMDDSLSNNSQSDKILNASLTKTTSKSVAAAKKPVPSKPSPIQEKSLLFYNQVYYRSMINYYSVLEGLCWQKSRSMSEREVQKMCPCISPFLIGEQKPQMENIPTIGELELTFTKLQNGGYFHPGNCFPRDHVAIIVPFRDRAEHLNIFLNHMHRFLHRQLIEYRIFVVEEVPDKIFNKAMMMNAGFVEAMKIFKEVNCVIFHDVDMLPEDDRNLYSCTNGIRHMGAFVDKWGYRLPYSILIGGAISMTPAQFKLVNGYSNEFFGWGGEDDDLYQRIKARKLPIIRHPKEVSKYTMIKHRRDKGNPTNKRRGVSNQWRPKRYETNGLNSLNYTLKAVENRPLYTWLYIDIDVPK